MGQLTVALTASTTVEGVTHSNNGSVVLNAANVSQQSCTLGTVYAQTNTSDCSYIAVINHGDESAFIQFVSSTPTYIVFECKPGQHILIPTAFKYGAADFVLTQAKMRAQTTDTRVTIICIELIS
jgi:hypothetical protein